MGKSMFDNIPFVKNIVDNVPSMDYEGQRLAERLYQCVIVLFAVVGFVWGFICQQFVQTVYILGAGVALAVLLVIPPWAFFRRHPLPWQKKAAEPKAAAASNKKNRPKTS